MSARGATWLPRIATKAGLKRGFTALQMAHWCTYASFATFFVALLTDTRGVAEMQIGALLSANMLFGAVGQFAINAICDRFRSNRRIFIILMAAILAIYFAIYFTDGFLAASALYILLGFALSAMPSTLDTWIIRSLRDEPGAYGPIRSAGCVAYALVVLALGQLIGRFGYAVTLASASLFAAFGIGVALCMPEIPRDGDVKTIAASERPKLRSVPAAAWALVFAAFLWGSANIPILQMSKLIIGRLGGTVTHMSYALFASAFAEFPLMFYSRRLMRKSPASKLVVASLAYFVSTSCMLLAKTPALIIVMFALNGSFYGLLLPAKRQMIAELAPEGLQNRMHGIADMAGGNLGGFVGNLAGGGILSAFGVPALLATCASLHAGSFLGMLNVRRLARRAAPRGGSE